MTEPIIRRATSDDAHVLNAAGRSTFTETFGHLYPPADLEQFLASAHGVDRSRADLGDPAQATWVVVAEGQVVGYALAGPCGLPHPDARPQDGELKRLYLDRAWQNRGLGGQLFAAAMGWLETQGPRNIWIGVWSLNHAAQRFYARHGFSKVGEYDFPVGQTLDREFILRRAAR